MRWLFEVPINWRSSTLPWRNKLWNAERNTTSWGKRAIKRKRSGNRAILPVLWGPPWPLFSPKYPKSGRDPILAAIEGSLFWIDYVRPLRFRSQTLADASPTHAHGVHRGAPFRSVKVTYPGVVRLLLRTFDHTKDRFGLHLCYTYQTKNGYV